MHILLTPYVPCPAGHMHRSSAPELPHTQMSCNMPNLCTYRHHMLYLVAAHTEGIHPGQLLLLHTTPLAATVLWGIHLGIEAQYKFYSSCVHSAQLLCTKTPCTPYCHISHVPCLHLLPLMCASPLAATSLQGIQTRTSNSGQILLMPLPHPKPSRSHAPSKPACLGCTKLKKASITHTGIKSVQKSGPKGRATQTL